MPKIPMRIISATIKFLLLLCLFQAVLAQEKPQSEQKKPIICSDCGFPLAAKAIILPIPEYPKAAIAVNASGAVQLSVVIDENGNVVQAKPISGHPLLWKASVDSALQAKFKPIMLSGKPVRSIGVLVYNYVPSYPTVVEKTQEKTSPSEIEKDDFQSDVSVIGKAVNLVKPPNPNCNCRFARKSRAIIQIEIDEQGNVPKASALAGHPILRQSSMIAARASKFSPTVISNVPVKAKAIISYEFVSSGKWAAKLTNIKVESIEVKN